MNLDNKYFVCESIRDFDLLTHYIGERAYLTVGFRDMIINLFMDPRENNKLVFIHFNGKNIYNERLYGWNTREPIYNSEIIYPKKYKNKVLRKFKLQRICDSSEIL